jgi:hypothetical protein
VFQECSRTLPSMYDKRYAPGLVFSITMYGPVHLGSNFPVPLVLGLRRSTRFPRLNSRSLTFGSLVYSWYFSKFTTAFSLSDSSKSFSSASFGHGTISVAIRRIQCFISSENIAYAPHINRKGVMFVTLQIVVLWLHTAVGMTSAHFSFFSPSNIFIIASNMRELALSTAPFDCGWYTDAKVTFVPIWWQNSLNIALSKYFALSIVICLGMP